MDPWGCRTERTPSNIELSDKSKEFFSFEDNFKPLVSDTLPDSKEYLAILESKLEKIKSDPNILRQLAEKREACMQQLLCGLSECNTEDDSLETPIESSTILRTIAPQKQALTEGERVELVKYDQLINEEPENSNKEESQSSEEK